MSAIVDNLEELIIERQKQLAPIHEAGHVIAARYAKLEIVSVDILPGAGGKCGNTRVVPMGADYSISTGLPKNKTEAFTGFNCHNFELLAGAAAQANYCYKENFTTLNGFRAIQPEIWGILIEFSKDSNFCEFNEERSTHGTDFFLTETGASGDWKELLNHFKMLPYHYFEELETHDRRIDYLRKMWFGALEKVQEQWDEVNIIAEALKANHQLSGKEVEALLT